MFFQCAPRCGDFSVRFNGSNAHDIRKPGSVDKPYLGIGEIVSKETHIIRAASRTRAYPNGSAISANKSMTTDESRRNSVSVAVKFHLRAVDNEGDMLPPIIIEISTDVSPNFNKIGTPNLSWESLFWL